MALKNCCSDGYTHTSDACPSWCLGALSVPAAMGMLDMARCVDSALLLLLPLVDGVFGTTSMLMRAECFAASAAAELVQSCCAAAKLSELHPGAAVLLVVVVALLLFVVALSLLAETGHPVMHVGSSASKTGNPHVVMRWCMQLHIPSLHHCISDLLSLHAEASLACSRCTSR